MVGNARKWLASLAGFTTVIAVTACGGGDSASDTTNVAGGTVAADSAAAATTPSTTATPGTAAGTAAAPLTIMGGDPEVLQFIAAVDLGEVEAGRLAQQQARNAQVKAFARTLVTDHGQSLRRLRQVAQKANVMLDTAALSGSATATTPATGAPGQLATMHRQTIERLRSMQGADFDSAFVNAQVTGHMQVLDALQRAQGQAQDSTVQRIVTTKTESVQKHLDRARELQQALLSGGTAATGDTTSKAKSDTGRRP